MLTRMTDEDWDRVVQVFRAFRSRRGDKGRNDRRFLEAVHYFCVHNITWAGTPSRVRQLELSLEALLAVEPGGRVRGLLRRARRHEPDGPLGSDVRLHHRSGPRLGRWS